MLNKGHTQHIQKELLVNNFFLQSPWQTKQAMLNLIKTIKESHFGGEFSAPKILLVAPVPIRKTDSPDFTLFYDEDSIALTQELPKIYAELAQQEDCLFLDAGSIVQVSSIDGVHFERDSHADLATAIARKIRSIF